MTWIKLKDDLPKRDNEYVLFVKWIQLNPANTKFPPLMLEDFAGTWSDIKNFRAYQLENSFTHWRKLGRAPKQ